MSSKRIFTVKVFLCALFLAVGACSPFGSGTKHPTRNYVLSSIFSEESRPQPIADLNNIGIVVGPVKLAMYLDRTDVVIRNSQNEIEIADFSSWAGPLQENFSRVLAENLSHWLNTNKVGFFPGTKLSLFDYSVTINVTRFDGRPGEMAHLRARWAIFDKTRKDILYHKHSVLSQATEGDSIQALVAAQSRLVADFSHEIAVAIKNLDAQEPAK